jgi:hypothetical protein
MDIEGMELNALKDGINVSKQERPDIIFESEGK